jgi:hypothetical protein
MRAFKATLITALILLVGGYFVYGVATQAHWIIPFLMVAGTIMALVLIYGIWQICYDLLDTGEHD